MTIGENTLKRIVAAVGETVEQKIRVAELNILLKGDDVLTEISKLRVENDRMRDAESVPGEIQHKYFWQHLLGLLSAVGLRFDDLYNYVIKREEGRRK